MIDLSIYIKFIIGLIIFIGLFSTFFDFKYKKIPNKLLSITFILTIVIQIVFIIIVHDEFYNKIIILKKIFNIIIITIISFIIWKKKYWGAGDAKLLIIYITIIPMMFYGKGSIPWFESLTFIFNLAFISLIFLVINLVIKIKPKTLLESIKISLEKTFNLKYLIPSISRLIFLNLIFILIKVPKTLKVILIILIFIFLEKKLNQKFELISLGLSIIIISSYYFVGILNSFQDLNNIIFKTTIIITVFKFIFNLLNGDISKIDNNIFIININSEKISKKDILNKSYYIPHINKQNANKIGLNKHFNTFFKNNQGIIQFNNFDKKYKHDTFLKQIVKELGLNIKKNDFTEEEIKFIKKLKIEITIEKSIPFALIMFITALSIIIINHNLFIYITMLIN